MSLFEIVPFLLGLVAAVAGGALIADALIDDPPFGGEERRRRPRPPRSLLGEGLIGVGLAGVAVVLLAGGDWSLSTPVILVAFALEIAGIALSARYLLALFTGPARRGRPDGSPTTFTRRWLPRRPADPADTPAPGWPVVNDD